MTDLPEMTGIPETARAPVTAASSGSATMTDAVGALLRSLGHGGMTAYAARSEMERLGFSSYAAQRAIQRALDAGAVALGPNLELVVGRSAQP